jgi:non-specific serine/threonine protein kinase
MDDRGEQPRYRLLETVRQFAQDAAAASGELESLRDRHLEWCCALAEQTAPLFEESAPRGVLARLDAEHDNFRTALRWAHTRGAIEAGLRLANALGLFWHWRGYLREARMWIDRLLASTPAHDAGRADVAALRSRALAVASNLAYRRYDLEASAALLEQSLALVCGQGDAGKKIMSHHLNAQALLLREQSAYARALEPLAESMALEEVLGDEYGVALALSNQGWVAHAQGDYARAGAWYAESLRRAREMGHTLLIGVVLGNQAHMAWATGDDAGAARLYRETLSLARQFGIPWGCAICLKGLGRVVARRGETERAVRWWGAAEAIRATVNVPLTPSDRRTYRHDESVAAAREVLGEALFPAAWQAGTALRLEAACAEALQG